MKNFNEKNNNKSRLTLKTLPFFSSSNPNDQNKSPKRFGDQNGVVGLGIVVALNDKSPGQNTQNPVFSVSPRSDPIPILKKNPINQDDIEIELLEEYTCVISQVGNNLIEKSEYFDDGFKKKSCVNGGGVFCAPSAVVGGGGGGWSGFDDVDFLSYCHLCKKKLHGLDIFMYRGEKAFCSEECRYQQISADEHKEKYASVKRKKPEYVDSLCSGPMQFSVGMVVA